MPEQSKAEDKQTIAESKEGFALHLLKFKKCHCENDSVEYS